MKSKAYKFAPCLLIALMLAVIAAGGWTLAASASPAAPQGGEVGYTSNPYTPNPNSEELWFADNTFNTRFEQSLDITSPDRVVTLTSFDLGINTIEIISYATNNYYLTLHPQYFGPVDPPYDDQYNAQYAMDLQGLLVWDDKANGGIGAYVDCFYGGFPKFPASYLQQNDAGKYYAQCIVTSSIENVETGDLISADWNGEVAYLAIPVDIWPD
jgi:hypothetical protein